MTITVSLLALIALMLTAVLMAGTPWDPLQPILGHLQQLYEHVTQRTELILRAVQAVHASLPSPPPPEPHGRMENLWVLHEDGFTRIPLADFWRFHPQHHRRFQAVQAADGRWYHHVGTQPDGEWVYRATD